VTEQLPIEEFGRFWLPEAPECVLAGQLQISDRGRSTLRLIGCFTVPDTQAPFGKRKAADYAVILGERQGGGAAVLLDCHTTNTRVPMIEPQGRAVAGEEFIDVETTLFPVRDAADLTSPLVAKASLTLSLSGGWADVPHIDASTSHEDGADVVRFSIEPDRVAKMPWGTLTVFFAQRWSFGRHRWSVVREPRFFFDLVEPLAIDDFYRDVVAPLQFFITFSVGEPSRLTSMDIATPLMIEGSDRDDAFPYAPVYFGALDARPDEGAEEMAGRKWQLPLPLSEIELTFERTLLGWFQLYADIPECLDLYFTTLNAESIFLETQFLLVAQALEMYHRRKYPVSEAVAEVHRERLAAILKACPDHHRKWLQEKLAFSHELTLIDRIREVFGDIRYAASGYADDKLAKKIRDTRNFLTHYDKRLEHLAARDSQLYWLSKVVTWLLQVCLLRDLGLTDKDVARCVGRTRHFQALKYGGFARAIGS
jgi:hypothetical protein